MTAGDLKLSLYHAAPYPLKCLAASAHGLRLRRWRYDASTDERVDRALERERWSAERWRAWRDERLAALLQRAATRVPHYRRLVRADGAGDRFSFDSTRLGDWPLLEKESLRAAPHELLADDVDPRRLYPEHSSGSTGTPVRLWWSHDTVRAWYAYFEARCRLWYGVSRHDRWAILGGQLVAAQARDWPPFWVWSAPLRQLYLSTVHLAPRHGADYLEALFAHEVRHLYGYPSALHALALAVADGVRDPHALGLEVIVTNAEPLYAHQRRDIESVFGCPVRETYGMAELVAAASECAHGRLHLWPEVGLVEQRDDGELVGTGLLNTDQPLIRYRVGDRGRLAPPGTACPCGRSLPILEQVEGRVDDVVVTPDGRRVGRLDPALKGDLPVRAVQIVQEALDRLVVRVVPASGWDAAAERALVDSLRRRLGAEMVIEVEEHAALERGPAGKLRAVVSRLPEDAR
ncbi:MAG: AMP-binding protein [Acidobacteriota bacterium]